MKRSSPWWCLFIGLVLVSAVGCRLLDLSDAGSDLGVPPSDVSGPANVRFTIVRPDIAPDLLAATNARVTFRLILITTGVTQNPTTVLTKTVDVTNGVAEFRFNGIPACTMIGELSIASGSIGGQTDFHGGADLTPGDNVVELAPKGCGDRADVVANVLKAIAGSPDLYANSVTNLAARIESAGAPVLGNPTATVYTDVLDLFVVNTFRPLDFTRLVIGNAGTTLSGSGLASWTRTVSELCPTPAGASAKTVLFTRIVRQGIGDSALVAWAATDGTRFGLSRIDRTTGALLNSFVNEGACDQTMVLPDQSVIVGGTLSNRPILFRWSGTTDAWITGSTYATFASRWVHLFTEVEADSAVPEPKVEYLEFDPSGMCALHCVVRDPKTRMTRPFAVDPATGGVTARTVSPQIFVWVAPGEGSNRIGWDTLPGIATYTLYWALSPDLTPASSAGRIASPSNPYTHENLFNGTRVYYIVTYTPQSGTESTASNLVSGIPRTVPLPLGVFRIAAGGGVSLVTKKDGSVWAWGPNNGGRLGVGTSTAVTAPMQVSQLTNIAAVSVRNAANYEAMAALANDGSVWTWGDNSYGMLGHGHDSPVLEPTQVAGMAGVGGVFVGFYRTFLVKTDGTVLVTGWNTKGQSGDGTTSSRNTFGVLPGLSGVIAVAPGEMATLFLKSDGTVLSTGDNSYGALGLGESGAITTPTLIPTLGQVVAVSAGQHHMLALRQDGTVYAWGLNDSGQLGDGTSTTRNMPVAVSGLTDIVAIAAGHANSFALKRDGTVYGWGWINDGQLGDGIRTQNRNTPLEIAGLSGIVAIAAGHNMVLAQRGDGALLFLGNNNIGTVALSPTPVDLRSDLPPAPFDIKGYPMTRRNILTWKGISATSSNLYWSTTAGVSKTNSQKIGNVRSPCNHTGLTDGTTYYYRVATVNSVGESELSSEVSFTPGPVTSVPDTTERSWTEATTWESGRVPAAEDDVVIKGNVILWGNATCSSVFVATDTQLWAKNGRLLVTGDFRNEGSAWYNGGTYSSVQFELEIQGNLTQQNVLSPSKLIFSGSTAQTITLGEGKTISGSIVDRTPSTPLRAGSDLRVKNLTLSFEGGTGTLDCQNRTLFNDEGSLAVTGGTLSNIATITWSPAAGYGAGLYKLTVAPNLIGPETVVVGDVRVIDAVVFEGNVRIASGSALNGKNGALTVKGNLVNEGTVSALNLEGSTPYPVVLYGNLTQVGAWTPSTTTFSGTSVQVLDTRGAKGFLRGTMTDTTPDSALQAAGDLHVDDFHLNLAPDGTATGTLDMNGYGLSVTGGAYSVLGGSSAFSAAYGKVTNIASITTFKDGVSEAAINNTIFVATDSAALDSDVLLHGAGTDFIIGGNIRIEGRARLSTGTNLRNTSWPFVGGKVYMWVTGAFDVGNGTISWFDSSATDTNLWVWALGAEVFKAGRGF